MYIYNAYNSMQYYVLYIVIGNPVYNAIYNVIKFENFSNSPRAHIR